MDAENIDGGDGRPPGCAGKVAVSIYRYFPHGGLQRDMMNTVMALRSRNVDVTIFCMSWEAPEIPENVTVRRLRLSGSTSARRARKFDLTLSRVLKKRDFDLHLSFNKVASADCYFVDDLPFARSDYKTPWWRRMFSSRWRIYSQMERQVFGNGSDALIFCQGEAQKRFYQSIYSTAESRFKLLPPGIDDIFCDALKFREERREVTRQELGIGKDEKALFMIGSAFYAKGADRAIAALASLPDRISSETRLFIVGSNDETYFRNLAKRCGVDDRVVFLGPRHDVPHLLAAADLLIHPARSEAAGVVLLEALCCGTPVLCSGNCGYANYVDDAGSVVLPRPFRQRNLNRALKLVLAVPENLDELRQSVFEAGFRSDNFRRCEQLADHIVGMLGDSRRAPLD